MKRKLITLIIALMLILSACEFPPTSPPEEEAESLPTKTFTPEPEPSQPDTAPEAEEIAEEPTATFTPTSVPCVELLSPLDLADLPAEGKVIFSWTPLDDAETYSLNFIFPDGLTLRFETNKTTKNRYMDGFSMHPAYNQSGEHQWYVTALNAASEGLCQSDFFIFTKPVLGNAPQGDNDGSDGGLGEGPPGFGD
ncbi:MAG: hypothetical protein HN736_04305 [Anaerolineae bacterium]|jgi:hypothetical protein|nr:hypothetical protein [Anaerolineae bacterium]MBT3711900.1 hypothetical protein [Anaerolineae bacterium]MBT4310976.1 hypothetical protein [Anaerolineae bacterium]MBT4459734.1 hypothetical protein [Anaerolineae bacterium]MBT4841836.1 hypothetical protein [Anaerolineae bacterium]